MLSAEAQDQLAVYCQATGHDQITALFRLAEIGLATWKTDPHYMPERVCGRVRTVITGRMDHRVG